MIREEKSTKLNYQRTCKSYTPTAVNITIHPTDKLHPIAYLLRETQFLVRKQDIITSTLTKLYNIQN